MLVEQLVVGKKKAELQGGGQVLPVLPCLARASEEPKKFKFDLQFLDHKKHKIFRFKTKYVVLNT